MKKILYSLAAVATLLVAASCAKDKETDLPDYLMGGSPVEVTFGVNAGQGLTTKAIADGTTANKLQVAWYEVGDEAVTLCDTKDANLANLTGNVTLTLAKGKSYKIVFWAAPVEGSPYELDFDAKTVTASGALDANVEANDAFYAVVDIDVTADTEGQEVTLTRPLAQIAVISPKANIDDSEEQIQTSSITVTSAYTVMNLLTGECSEADVLAFEPTDAPLEALTWNDADYYYVATAYVLAPANGMVAETIAFEVNENEHSAQVVNAALKRNYRTVIAGNILPAADPNTEVEWTVTVDPEFGGENESNVDAEVPEVTFVDPDDPQANPLPAQYDPDSADNESMDLDPDTPTAMFQVQSPSPAEIQVSSSDETVATAEIEGEDNNVTITAVGNGEALITISQDAYQEAANPAPGLHKAPGDNYAAYSYTFLVKVEGIETPEPPQPGEGFTFEKVTAISAGEYLIVCESENVAFNGALTEKLDVASNNIAVTIENGKIVLENKNAIFTVAAVDGGYSIKSASGIYIGGESGANKIVESTTEAYVNTVAFSEGNAIITSNTSFIQYNKTSGQERFRYYKANTTTQQPVALYKLSDGTTPEPPQPGEPADAVITLSGVPTEALAAGASFDLVVSTESTGEIAVAADPAEAVTIAPKANADNTWTVTAAELEADTEVTLTVTTAAVENTWKAGEETATFTVAKKTGGEVPPATEYDFTSIAELNALATSTAAEKSGTLNNAVVSFVPDNKNAIIKDETGSVLLYLTDHGLKQGQTFTGELTVTITLYQTLAELTACDAAFQGDETVVEPAVITLANLAGNVATYQNAYVKVEDLTVSSVNGKNVNVTDGTNDFLVYSSAGNATCQAGDVISVIGTVTHYGSNDQIKAWTTDDITVTTPHVASKHTITFTQPNAGGSFTVSVGGNNIDSGTEVMEGETVTLTATPASGYVFGSWTVTGATVSGSTGTDTFVVGMDDVSITATFVENNGSVPTPETIVFANLNLENAVQYTDPFNGGNFTITFGGGGNDGKYYTTGSGIRTYGDGTITVASTYNIAEIEFTWDGSYKPDADVANPTGYSTDTGKWTGSAKSIVLTRPSGSGHWRLQSVKVTYAN